MKRKKILIRKIIFGIRFKFSIIIILAVLLVSTMIGFALLNQHEKKIKDSLLRQGVTILEGIADQARIFLANKHTLYSDQATTITPMHKMLMAKQQTDALKKMSTYFSSVIGKEAVKEQKNDRILDIAYMVDCNWQDMHVDWKRWDQTLYVYFNRITGDPFMQKNGRKDPLLEPTIINHYMNNIDITPFIGFASSADVHEQYKYLFENKPSYVIMGIPIFRQKTTLYNEYLEFKHQSPSQATVQLYLERKKNLPRQFLNNIVSQGIDIDYRIDVSSAKNRNILLNFLLSKSTVTRLKPAQLRQLTDEFMGVMDKSIGNGTINISRTIRLWEMIQKKYDLPPFGKSITARIRSECFQHLSQFGISLSTDKTLDELALISFRRDLAGVLGLYLYRAQYFPEMVKHENEIINLMISILLRAIFLALLFPTFIIRSIKTLEDGAIEIGKGNLEKRIDISGSDEIGRLADIFNVMTENLKKAEDIKIEKVRMEKELLTAQQIQAALLPAALPELKGVEFGAYYSAQTESGGDYYDCIDLNKDQVGITIADVSGHGVGSGLVMAMTRTLLHTYCMKTTNTKKILESINEYLKNNTASNYFVTMFYGILNLQSMKMSYSSAGHCEPILIRNGKIHNFAAGGIALGVISGETFSKAIDIKELTLQKGDYFVQYTDGVDEAMDADNNEFGMDRFHKALLAHEGKHPQEMTISVIKEIDTFTGAIPQHDDITMIIIRIP